MTESSSLGSERCEVLSSAVDATVDLDAGAGWAEADGVAAGESSVVGLKPEVEAEPAHQRTQDVAIAVGVRPHPLEAARELFFFGMGFVPEHRQVPGYIDTGCEEKILCVDVLEGTDVMISFVTRKALRCGDAKAAGQGEA